MPLDPELIQAVETWDDRTEYDPHAPYTVRRKVDGPKDSRGQNLSGAQYETRTITNMRTQPLGYQDYSRLPEGMRELNWRFAMVVADVPGELPTDRNAEFLRFGDQVKYDGDWWEVKFINNWDIIQSCKMARTE